ncbi:hypothetical protein KCU98_g6179, partial [Aureobasidium melanogenum]
MTSLSFSLGGSSSKSTQRRSSPPPPKRTNGTKRDHAALLDDASDDEDANHSKRQTITHFDSAAGGAVDARAPKKEEKKPLVITALANRDWREASKRQRAQKYGITTEQLDARRESAQNAEGADKVVKETEAVKYGLNVFAPSATASAEDTQQLQEPEQIREDKPEQQKTADQLAIDALTGAAPTSTLTIPTTAVTEEDAFNDSYHSAPPAPSLSDYAAVPVEEYGAAMLRGMGWKGPSTTSSQPKTTKKQLPPAKRPALLGIGADPNAAAQAEELGAWGKSSSRGRKEPTMFIPVSMKNKKTGETLTEEELRDKIRRDKEEAENQRFIVNDLEIRDKKRERRDEDGRKRRDEYYSDNDDEKEEEKRRRRKDRERDYDRHDHRSRDYDRKDRRDRDRSRDRETRRDRSRDRDYYDKKSSSRRDRSRDRGYERRDRDYEKSSGRRDHRYEDSASKSSSRRDRSRDGDYHRSSRR